MATIERSEVGPFLLKRNASEGYVLGVEDEGVAGPGIECARVVRAPSVESLDQSPRSPTGSHLRRSAACQGVEHKCAKEVWEGLSEACM